MTERKQTNGAVTFPSMPEILSPDAVYDLLIHDIEPELVSDVVNTLEEKYRDEKPEQARVRAERYAVAFEEYDRRLDVYISKLNEAMNHYARAAAASLEAYDRKSDDNILSNLESEISS